MPSDFTKYYQLGIEYKKEGKYDLSAEYHIKALDFVADFPEAWHQAGAALLRISEKEKALPYLQKARDAYHLKIEAEEKTAYYLFGMARVSTLLEEKEMAIQALQKAIEYNPIYAEEAQSEEDLESLHSEEAFQNLIQNEMEALAELRYRGQSLLLEELDEFEQAARLEFVNILREAQWDTEEVENLLKEGLAVAPQALGESWENPLFCIRLSYHIDEKLVFMELMNRQSNEVQSFRLYYKKKAQKLLPPIIAFAPQLNEENWMELIKKLIPLCGDLLYELPNGSKMKLSKF